MMVLETPLVISVNMFCAGFGYKVRREETDVRCPIGSVFIWRVGLIISCQHCSKVCPFDEVSMY